MKLTQIFPFGVVACALLSACQPTPTNSNAAAKSDSPANQPSQASQANANSPKVLRVSSELSKFPVVMHDGKGKTEGFEAELLQAVAEKQGFTVQYSIDTWANLLKKLGTDDTDMVMGSITINDERKKTMDFTEPVLPYKTGVMVVESLADAKTFHDLRGKKVNLRKNTVYEKLVPIFSVDNGSNMVYPENVWGQVKSLLSGESEAMVGASITLEYYQAQHADKKFHIVYEPNATVSHYGWAVKKGDTATLQTLNEGLAKAKADGTYKQIYQKYWPNSPVPN